MYCLLAWFRWFLGVYIIVLRAHSNGSMQFLVPVFQCRLRDEVFAFDLLVLITTLLGTLLAPTGGATWFAKTRLYRSNRSFVRATFAVEYTLPFTAAATRADVDIVVEEESNHVGSIVPSVSSYNNKSSPKYTAFHRHFALRGGGIGGDHERDDDADGSSRHSFPVVLPRAFRNEYYALRHGQSLANVAGIIVSNPEIACVDYGLSDTGRQQAHRAGKDVVQTFVEQHQQNNNQRRSKCRGLVIVSSDFLRAKETAQHVLEAVQNETVARIPVYHNQVLYVPWLRERRFGDWDGTKDANYAKVWQDDVAGNDESDESNQSKQVESVESVRDRVLQGLIDLEQELRQQLQDDQDDSLDEACYMVICVAHGDVLQILQTAFCGMDCRLHRSLPHLETATLRPLRQNQLPTQED